MWWRIWIPTWRFFDHVGVNPKLYARLRGPRTADESSDPGAWTALISEPPARSWRDLFFNPAWNLHHARINLLERLVLEAQTAPDPRALVSYRLVCGLARDCLFAASASASASAGAAKNRDGTHSDAALQFKIQVDGLDAVISSEEPLA